MSPDEIDRAILVNCRAQWLKVARVIWDTDKALEALGAPTDLDAIAGRIVALVEGWKAGGTGQPSQVAP
jgi:hypothetical protein